MSARKISSLMEVRGKNPAHKKVLSISIGICAYNEERNIYNAIDSLLRQETENVRVEEIIVISDGNTDRTTEIVETFSSNGKIKLIKQRERRGKYAATNIFFELATAPVLVLSCADIVLDKRAIENLCAPFLSDATLGITAARPVPTNMMDSFLGYTVNLQWFLHHRLSLEQPKFGELIAFRNRIVDRLPPTLVDEEQIASIIKTKGYSLRYLPDAIVYNKGPENIRDFLIRRSRIYAGHLMLKKKDGYEVITLNGIRILKCLLAILPYEYKKNTHWLLGAILLEILGRMWGRLDILFKKYRFNYRWETAKSTKYLTRYNEEAIRY